MMPSTYEFWMLSRGVGAAAIGAGLGLTGSMLQRYLNNDLADPYLLGISGGALLGSIALAVFVPAAWIGGPVALLAVTLVGAFLFGSLLLGILIWGRQRLFHGRSGLVLFGVAINGFCAAVSMLLMSFDHPLYPRVDYARLVGRIESYGVPETLGLLLLMGIGGWIFLANAPAIERAPYGEFWMRKVTKSPGRSEQWLLVGVVIIVCTTTAFAGAIGFVGLVIPHLARAFARSFRQELWMSAVLGGALVVAADGLAQRIVYPRVLPVGVLTALGGALALGFLLMRRASRGREHG